MGATASTSSSRSGSIGPPRGSPVYDLDPQQIIDAIQAVEHPEDDPERKYLDSALSVLDLPGFGAPLDDCGDYIPESMHFCEDCWDVKEFARNCYRYDCPDHAPYAIRRRVAGSKDAAGVAPQLDALRRYLYAYRDDNQYFHHLTIEPPEDFWFESDEPLKRAREYLIPEVLDALGIQGIVAYHPLKGDHEDHDRNDIGAWKDRLFSGRDWDSVREELKRKPHFHVVGVAPHIDLEDVGEIYDETGWVIHRIVDEETNISIEDDDAMAAAVLYALSHAGIYDTDSGQRRLAAWMKGPDVNRVTPTETNKRRMKAIVNAAAEDSLGITAVSLTCDNELPPTVRYDPDDTTDDDLVRASEQRRERDPWAPDPLGGLTGPDVATSSSSSAGRIPTASTTTRTDSAFDGRRDHDPSGFGFGSPRSLSSSGSSSTTTGRATSDHRDRDDVDGDVLEPCEGVIRHISQAGEYLLDGDRRAEARYVDDLETAYTSYLTVMRAKGLEAERGRREIPEFTDRDRPPDD